MKSIFTPILNDIKTQGNYRKIRYHHPLSATRILYEGTICLNLCSNSYLSLHTHPDVISAAKEATDNYGAGTCSSRSVSGSIDLYNLLEEEIARYKGYGKALIFSNGYMANIGIVSTMTSEKDVIFSDELNHSSLIDAIRLSRVKKIVYRHNDVTDLQSKIKKHRGKGQNIVITEAVFSMDGDLAPLADIYQLRNECGLRVFIDDAHGTGVFGKKGTGVEEMHGLAGKMDIQMATFGKSLGSYGAVVLSDPVVIDFLINRARTFMYTTALPPAALGASLASLAIVKKGHSHRKALWGNISYMRENLIEAGFDLMNSKGPIVPIVVGPDTLTLKMQEKLLEKGIFLQAIRPPTVPKGTSRLRLTVVAGFTRTDMDRALEAIIETGREMKLI